MKNIPITTITFDIPIIPHALRKLRGAVVESVMQHKAVFEAAGVPTELFHNHKEEVVIEASGQALPEKPSEERSFDYPKIQYKIRHKRIEIMGVGAGAQALQLWVSLAGETLNVNGEEVPLSVRDHHHEQWKPILLPETRTYRLNKWLPFNPKNFDLWHQTPKLKDKADILDKLIWGHLFHLSDGLGFELNREQVEIFVSTVDMMSFKDCYGIKKLALDITFYTNFNLPEEIGLGQGITIGFGKVQQIKKPTKNKK